MKWALRATGFRGKVRPLVITKRGKPVAQLVPMPLAPALFGALAGSVLREGDLVSGIGDAWDADR